MNLKSIIYILLFSAILTSCLSSSNKQHSCNCAYPDQIENIIKDINSFSDLESGRKCDQKCGFRRLLVLFYNDSDSSRQVLDLIESNPTLVNCINDNFAFVCLSTEKSAKNLDIQMKKFNNNQQPYFAILTSFNDSLITSFGYMNDAEKMNSLLMETLY